MALHLAGDRRPSMPAKGVHRPVSGRWTWDSFADMGCRAPLWKMGGRVHKRATPVRGRARTSMIAGSRHDRALHPQAEFCRSGRRRRNCAGAGPCRLRGGAENPRHAAAPRRNRCHSGQAHHRRSGRICRPLRRGRFGRDSRARFRLSRSGGFQGWADGQAGRPAVHHRQAAVPEHARPGARQPHDRQIQSRLHASRPRAGAQQLVRDQTITDQILRAALPGIPQCPGLGGGERGAGAPGRARSAIHRAQGADCRPHRRPAGDAWQPGDRRHRRQHHALGHHRVGRPDPLRVHLR